MQKPRNVYMQKPRKVYMQKPRKFIYKSQERLYAKAKNVYMAGIVSIVKFHLIMTVKKCELFDRSKKQPKSWDICQLV